MSFARRLEERREALLSARIPESTPSVESCVRASGAALVAMEKVAPRLSGEAAFQQARQTLDFVSDGSAADKVCALTRVQDFLRMAVSQDADVAGLPEVAAARKALHRCLDH